MTHEAKEARERVATIAAQMWHRDECVSEPFTHDDCSCGLDNLRAAILALGGGWQDISPIDASDIESAAMRVYGWVTSARVTVTVEQLRQWAVEAQVQPEIGWLVEMIEPANNKAPCPRWWHPDTGWTWDSNNALRFAREKDAQDYITSSRGIHGKATKHSWHPSSAKARAHA